MSIDIRAEFNRQCGEITSLVSQLGASDGKGKELQEQINDRIGNLQGLLDGAGGAKRFSEGSVVELNAYRERILKSDPKDLDREAIKDLTDRFQIIQRKVIGVMTKFDSPISLLPTAVEGLIRENLELGDARALAKTGTGHQKSFAGDSNYKYLALAKKLGLHGVFSPNNAERDVRAHVEATVAVLRSLYPTLDLGAETDAFKQLQIFQKLNVEDGLKEPNFEAFEKELSQENVESEVVDRIFLAVADMMNGKKQFDLLNLPPNILKPLLNFCSPQVLQTLMELEPFPQFYDPKTHKTAFLMTFMQDNTTLNVHEKLDIILNKLIDNKEKGFNPVHAYYAGIYQSLLSLLKQTTTKPDFETHVRKLISMDPSFRLDPQKFAEIPNHENLSPDLAHAVVFHPDV